MTQTAEESGKSSALSDLTLQVRQAGVAEQEVFLQHGLSLGRNASNTLCIDHPEVERIHAQVIRQADGSMLLECAGPTTHVDLADGTKVSQLALKPGTTFKLGPATIRCLKRETKTAFVVTDNPWQVRCPRCHEIMADAPKDMPKCPKCDAELFYFRQERSDPNAAGFEGWLPRQIGPYKIRAFVAQGGMGVVLRGLHQDNDMLAAVKILRGDADADPTWKTRFEAEIGTLITLKHPNVVRLQDHGRDGKLLWLAMDWIDGVPLTSWISKMRGAAPLPIEQIRGAMAQVLSGLQYLHGWQIVHRDLKPGNILCAQDDLVKMVDFGIARSSSGETSVATRMTQTGMVTGTESYMAPEQAEGRGATAASDIYAVGVIWYELLTARRPMGAFVPPELVRGDTPLAWSRLIARCLSNDPGGRPSIDEMIRVLSGAVVPPPLPGARVMPAPTPAAPAPMSGVNTPAHIQAPVPPPAAPQSPVAPPPAKPGLSDSVKPILHDGAVVAKKLAGKGSAAVASFLQKHPPKKWAEKLAPLASAARKNPKVWIGGGIVGLILLLLLIVHSLPDKKKTADAPAENNNPAQAGGNNNPGNTDQNNHQTPPPPANTDQRKKEAYAALGKMLMQTKSAKIAPIDNQNVVVKDDGNQGFEVDSAAYGWGRAGLTWYPFSCDMTEANGQWTVENFEWR